MMSAYSGWQEGGNLQAEQLNFSIRRISEIAVEILYFTKRKSGDWRDCGWLQGRRS